MPKDSPAIFALKQALVGNAAVKTPPVECLAGPDRAVAREYLYGMRCPCQKRDNCDHPIPCDCRNEQDVIHETAIETSERMLQEALFEVPLPCICDSSTDPNCKNQAGGCCDKDDQGPDVACCSKLYQRVGGCPAATAQHPGADYTYHFNYPSLKSNVDKAPLGNTNLPLGYPFRLVPRQMHGTRAPPASRPPSTLPTISPSTCARASSAPRRT